jgi:two-component system, OmpR family, sensor kinase
MLLLLALPAAVAVTAGGGWWLARRALTPIDRMTRTAEVIAAHGLSERVPVAAIEDEVAHLGRTLNAMLDRIERAVGEQHRLVSDTSHELRTPLAIMRSEIDVSLRADDLPPAARDVLDSVREEVEHMTALVEDLLTLASADEGRLRLAREPTDVLELAVRAAASFRGLAERRRVRLEVQGDDAVALADLERISHAIRNLVANAIDFSPPGGTVRLSTSATDGHALLDVTDEGPGIPATLRDRVFNRFFRADPSRTRDTGGRGLGLAIVREVVVAHEGSITVEPNQPRGCRFRMRLPAA